MQKKPNNSYLKRKYNCTLADYEVLFKNQNGQCYICNKTESMVTHSGDIKPLILDHNHKTGKNRGLLCNSCNCGLGFFKDNINLLKKAIIYLKRTDGD